MHKSVLALCLLFSVGSYANDKALEAAKFYDLRDFNAEGIANVETSIDLFEEALTTETDGTLKLNYRNSIASSQYFVGTALPNNDENKDAKKASFAAAMATADGIITELGVDVNKVHELTQDQVNATLNSLDPAQEAELAEAMYTKGTSLAQWGKLNGITSSLGKLPIVLGIMARIEMLGKKEIHNYGPYRTIGRIKFSLPKIAGGDNDEAIKKLGEAVKNTKAEGQVYSINGYNNIYLAQSLYKAGKENKAKEILQLFVDGDFNLLLVGYEPENREALRVAQGLLDGTEDWE